MIPAIIGAAAALGSAAMSANAQSNANAEQNKLTREQLNQQMALANQERADKFASINQANRAIDDWNASAQQILNNAMQGQQRFSSPSDMEAYQALKSGYNPGDYVYDFDRFDSSRYNVDDYLNPNKDRILSDVAKASQATAAGTGMGRSSGAAQAINQSIVDKSEALYNDARNQMNQDKSFDYNAYSNYINQMQNKLNTLQSGNLNQMNMLKGDLQLDQNMTDQNVQNQLSLGNSIANSKAQLLM